MARLVLIALVVSAAAGIFYFGVYTDRALPDHRLIHGINDLFFHVIAFWVLTFLLGLILKLKTAIAVNVVAALAIEFVQMFQPSRTASLDDLLASLAGVALGAVSAVSAGLVIRWRRNQHGLAKY